MKNVMLLVLSSFLCVCCVDAETEVNINVEKSALIPFYEKSRIGFFDEGKKVVFPAKYTYVSSFNEGYAIVSEYKNKFSVINAKGNILFDFENNGSYHEGVHNNLIRFSYDKKNGFYDLKGNILLEGINSINSFSDGLICIPEKNHYAFVNNEGKYLRNSFFQKIICDTPTYFFDGFARISEKQKVKNIDEEKVYRPVSEKYGFMDKKGNIIIPIKYAKLDSRFINGYAKAAEEVGFEELPNVGLIDNQGKWMFEPKYYETRDFSGKVVAVRYKKGFMGPGNTNWKLIDRNGKDVYVFNENVMVVSDFDDGLAIYAIQDENNKLFYGFFNEAGSFVTEPIFNNILTSFTKGYCTVQIGNEMFLFSITDGIVKPSNYLDFSLVEKNR